MLENKRKFYKSLKETLVEYFKRTSLNGFGLLYYIRRRKYQCVFWFMFILLGISFATYVIMCTLTIFLKDPTVTSLDSKLYNIWQIPHPAVSLCSNNKLSKLAMENYAQELMSKCKCVQKRQYWLNKISFFMSYFDANAVDVNLFDDALELQKQFESMQNVTVDGHFNIETILRRLVPTCNDLLINCRLFTRLEDCNKLFQLHATVNGYCCIFNYQRSASDESIFPLIYPNGTGMEQGLILFVNTTTADYFYNERSTSGFSVQIFSPNSFPDTSTGEVLEFYVGSGEELEIQLSVVNHVTASEVHGYTIQKRGCYFPDEDIVKFGLSYSQAECLTKCKIENILRMCDCIPFYTTMDFIDGNSNVKYCTLEHLQCMQRYHVALETYHPVNIQDSNKELEDAIICKTCLPLCSYNQYNYNKKVMNLSDTIFERNNKKFFSSTEFNVTKQLNSVSLIKLYFSKAHALQYRKSVLYNWYQILSNIGGVIGICMGCSLISAFEIIYFMSYRLIKNIKK